MLKLETVAESNFGERNNLAAETRIGNCIVLYDSVCNICGRFRRVIEFLDPQLRLEFVPLSRSSSVGVNLPESILWRSFHFLNRKGEVTSGAEAIPNLVAELPAGVLLRAMLKTSSGQKLVRFLYGTLSRLHAEGACKFGNRGWKYPRTTPRTENSWEKLLLESDRRIELRHSSETI